MANKDIIKMEIIKDVKILNTHNEKLFPKQDIMLVKFRNEEVRVLDLFSEKDITDIDYLEVIYPVKMKTKVIFEEEID